jgi:type I restriction enzyme S subunit
LFTRYNGSLELLGVCGMVRGLGKRILLYPDKLMRVRFGHPHILPQYCELFFSEPSARDRMIAKAKSSAGQNGVSGTDVKNQSIALPPFGEQQEIVRRVGALFSLADAIERRVAAATQRADKLTQAILAKAFRGELVPTEAELARAEGRDYEPASVLLERIREGGVEDGNRAATKAKRQSRTKNNWNTRSMG